MLHLISKRILLQEISIVSLKYNTQVSNEVTSQSAINTNVPGLSENCVKVPNTPVGPGAAKNKEYKNPEYFCYNMDTIGESEVELAKYRLQAPSNKRPYHR